MIVATIGRIIGLAVAAATGLALMTAQAIACTGITH